MKNIPSINPLLALLFLLLIAGCTLDDPTEDQFVLAEQNALLQSKLNRLADPKSSESMVQGSAIQIKEEDLAMYKASRLKFNDQLNREISTEASARFPNFKIIELHPTGNSMDDFINIQAALDEAGELGMDLILLLRSTNTEGVPTKFNLERRQIVLNGERNGQTGKVTLIGETRNGFMTTLKGGAEFFRLGVKERRLLLALEREQITIFNIAFEDGHITTAGGGGQPLPGTLIIKSSRFTNNNTGTIGSITTFGTTKKLLIEDCHFDNNKLGIWVLNDNPEAIIRDNTITNASGGISVGNNASGNYKVYDNEISSTPLAPGARSVWEMGILVRTVQDTKVDIYENDILIDGPSKTGIFVFGATGKKGNPDPMTGVSIQDNEITINSDLFAAIDITASAIGIENLCVSSNEIIGSSGFAFAALSSSNKQVRNITYVDNQIDNFTSTCLGTGEFRNTLGCADVFFGSSTSDIRYCGVIPSGFADNGTNNNFSKDDDICHGCGDE